MRKARLAITICLAFLLIQSNAYAQCDIWKARADFGGTARYLAVGFSIGAKGYIGTGSDGVYRKDFWEYDPSTDTWTQKADFGGVGRRRAVGFTIGNKGYIGTGEDMANDLLQDFWEYDQSGNTWVQKADFGGSARRSAIGVAISGKGYIGLGSDVSSVKDFWEYDPATDIWTQKSDFGGPPRSSAASFSIDGIGYVGLGTIGYVDLWAYNPIDDTWSEKGAPLHALSVPVCFTIGGKGYVGTGIFSSFTNELWEYDPTTDSWVWKKPIFGSRAYASGFSIGNKGYIGTGNFNTGSVQNFYEYTPGITVKAGDDITLSCGDSIEIGGLPTVASPFPLASYDWTPSIGLNDSSLLNPSASPLTSTTYYLTGTDSIGCSGSDSVRINVIPYIVDAGPPSTIGCGDTAILTASFNNSASYSWTPTTALSDPNSRITSAYPLATTNYFVTAAIPGCDSSSNNSYIIVEKPAVNPICFTTLDNTLANNVIVWEKPIDPVIGSFNVYRDIVGVYSLIGSVDYADIGSYTDSTVGLNPNSTSYKYKISTVDTCGNEGPLSDYHKTILLQVSFGIPPAINLNWDDYEGLVVNYYRILRDTTGLGVWEKIDSVAFGFNSYTDNTPPESGGLEYRIEAILSTVCASTPFNTSKSNIIDLYATGIINRTEDNIIIIYPNPTVGIFNIEIEASHSLYAELSIFNFLGEEVWSERLSPSGIHGRQIDLSKYPAGIYIVKLVTANDVFKKQVILE